MAKKSWFTARASKVKGVGEVSILNDIGGWGVSAQDFHDSLQSLGPVDELHVNISSDGGDVFTGFAIYNMLETHAARKVVTVQGLAASMASVIAMAGDEVQMPANAMLMVHNPTGVAMGGEKELASFAEALGAMRKNIAHAYVARSGMTEQEAFALMDKESWLTAEQAVALGLADTVIRPLEMAAAFNLTKFKHAPKSFGQTQESNMSTGKKAVTAANSESESSSDTPVKAETAAEMAARIRKEVSAHAAEVRAVCALAGKADLADGFIAEDKSVAEVVAALTTATKPKGKEVDAHHASTATGARGNEDGLTVKAIDPTAIWAKFNKRK